MTGHDAGSNELARYLTVPLRRWKLVVFVVLLGVAATLAYVATGTKTYTSTALVDLHQISTSPFDATKSSNQLIDVATEAKTATSEVVAAKASDLLSAHPPTAFLQSHVKVVAATGTTTLSVSFTAPSAVEAAAGANAFAKAYLDTRSLWADKRRQQLVDTIDDSLKSLRSQLSKVNKSLASADPASASAQDDLTTRTLLTQQFADLSQRENELTGMSLDPGQVVSSAIPGEAKVAPNRKLYLVAGLLISLLLGVMAGLARESLDRRLRTAEQFEHLIDAAALSTGRITHELLAGQARSDDAMYVLRSRVLNAVPADSSEVLLLIDLSNPLSAGAVGAQLAQLMANTGAGIQLIMVTDGGETRTWLRDDDPTLASATERAVWLQFSDPDNVAEQHAISLVIEQARNAGLIAVLAMVGRPRRSALVAMSAMVDDVILVAEAGYTRIATVRTTTQDIADSGVAIFAGVLIRSGRFRRSSPRPIRPEPSRSSPARGPAHVSSASGGWTPTLDEVIEAEPITAPAPIQLRLSGAGKAGRANGVEGPTGTGGG